MHEEGVKLSLPIEFYAAHLKIINNVKFRRREIDVIAFMLNGRSGKKTASFLSLSPKTIENYTQNIMVKLECNSRESIIDFIEKSDQLGNVRKYYSILLIQEYFESKMKEIDIVLSKDKRVSVIIYYQKSGIHEFLLQEIQRHLKILGVNVFLEVLENEQSFSEVVSRNSDMDYIIYAVPAISELTAITLTLNHHAGVGISQRIGRQTTNVLLLFLGDQVSGELPIEAINVGCLCLFHYKNYYLFFFELLTKLFPKLDLEKTIADFNKKSSVLFDNLGPPFHGIPTELQKGFSLINQVAFSPMNFLKQWKWPLSSFIFVCLLLFSGSLVNSQFFKEKKKNFPQPYNPQVVSKLSIQPDLPIPTDNVFLHRSELMKKIEDKLKGEQGIQAIALVGIGGSGKTTIARQYARQQNSPIVWEINAETQTGIVESFEKFAHDLAKIEEDKRLLRRIMEIKEPTQREEKIIHFVKRNLRAVHNWILIYDNIERFSDVEKCFPQDSNIWGKGKVIVTTRDSTIQNNSYIKNAIMIGELASHEKIKLFQNIMGKDEENPMAHLSREEIMKFLDELPPFPLDISLAAFYLKTTNTPYQRYLENISTCNKAFEGTQEKMLKEASVHTKTRYNIITLSLKQITSTHEDFEDLLLFISLLDSQAIPKGLLDSYKNNTIVDSFIFNLKKYSLLTNGKLSASGTTPSLFIHRTTQVICLNYLIKTVDIKKKTLSFSQAIENYTTNALNKVDYSIIKILARHCEVFLSHNELLPNNIAGFVEGKLGNLYFYLGDYAKAMKKLEESLQKLNENDTKDRSRFSQILVNLGVVYRKFGKNEKAKNSIEKSIIMYKKYFPDNHLEYAWALGNLGSIYRNLGNYKKAKELLEESLAVYHTHFDKDYIGNGWILVQLGNIYRHLGEYNKAHDLAEKGLVIYKKNLPENHTEIAWSLAILGNIYRDLGQYNQAERMLKQSLKMYEEQFGKDHVESAWILAYLGKIYRDLGYHKKAIILLQQAYHLQKAYYIQNPIRCSWYSTLLGRSYLELANYEKAKALLEEGLIIHEKNFGKKHIFTAWGMEYLGEFYKNIGNYKQAEDLFKQSLKIYEHTFGDNPIKIARVLLNLGEVYFFQGHLEAAEKYINKALTMFRSHNHPECYKALEALTEIPLKRSMDKKVAEDAQNYKKQAIEYQRQALEIAKTYFPDDSPHIIRIQTKLNALRKVGDHPKPAF